MSDESLIRRPTMAPEHFEGRLESEDTVREFLAFVVDGETYALPLHAVREILKLTPITLVPRAPGDVLGIISVRGRMTTVVDLRRLLNVAEAERDKNTRILLVDNGEEVIGLLVDRVLQVYRLHESEIELAGVVGSDLSEHVFGIGRPNLGRETDTISVDEIIVLLDPVPLLRR